LGNITFKVQVSDNSGIETVSFYINDEERYSSSTPPYEWNWAEQSFGFFTLEIIAEDFHGNSARERKFILNIS